MLLPAAGSHWNQRNFLRNSLFLKHELLTLLSSTHCACWRFHFWPRCRSGPVAPWSGPHRPYGLGQDTHISDLQTTVVPTLGHLQETDVKERRDDLLYFILNQIFIISCERVIIEIHDFYLLPFLILVQLSSDHRSYYQEFKSSDKESHFFFFLTLFIYFLNCICYTQHQNAKI